MFMIALYGKGRLFIIANLSREFIDNLEKQASEREGSKVQHNIEDTLSPSFAVVRVS